MLAVVLLLADRMPAQGGLDVKLRMIHDSLLRFEPAMAVVSIYNDSDNHIVFEDGKDLPENSLRFVIMTRSGRRIEKNAGSSVIGGLVLYPGDKVERLIDIGNCYDIFTAGNYSARLEVFAGDDVYRSNVVLFDIVTGIELVSEKRGFSGYDQDPKVISLRYWTRGGGEQIFLSVDNPDGSVNYGVFALGRLLRLNKPVLQTERNGTVRVLHQTGYDLYTRTVFRISGDSVELLDQSYFKADGTPLDNSPGAVSGTGE